ncbi:MAG: hypothetical protein JWO40_148 [Candidatus Doudnabacteria bacterium]|nr:hypothetical protein [Candidatus Doudnabacteria bacterium]
MHRLFPGQQDDEEIVLVIRQHWFYLSAKILLWLVFVAILFVFDYFTPMYIPSLFQGGALPYVNLMKNIYLMFLILGLFMIWIIHYLNVWIITNKRVVCVFQKGIFEQRISELTFPNVEDISSDTNGIFGTFMSYGNVEVETAGEKENFVFENVPKPKDIERLIFNLMDKHPTRGNV